MQTALRSDSCRSIVIVFRCFRARKCTRRTQICRKLPRRWRPLSNIRAFTLRENISFSEAWLNEKRPPDKRHALRSYFQHKPQEVRSKAHDVSIHFVLRVRRGNPNQKQNTHTIQPKKRSFFWVCIGRCLFSFHLVRNSRFEKSVLPQASCGRIFLHQGKTCVTQQTSLFKSQLRSG